MTLQKISLSAFTALALSILVACSSAARATTWYFSPAGSDSNSGASSSPWLTPGYHNGSYHPGDTLHVAAGVYNAPYGWELTASGNATAGYITLQCAPGFGTKLIGGHGPSPAISVTKGGSYWDIRGCDVASTGRDSSGILVSGNGAAPFGPLHHIIIEGNAVHGNSCAGIAVSGNSNGNGNAVYPIDYVTIRDNTVYENAFTSAYHCSGISIYEPIAYDAAPGYHLIIQGNVAYGNHDCDTCGEPTDGNGIILDDFKYSQRRSLREKYGTYGQRTLVADNIAFNNGGRGIHAYESQNIVIAHNTAWGNNLDPNPTVCASGPYGGYEIGARDSTNVSFHANKAQAFAATCNGTSRIYAFVDDAGPGATSSSNTFTNNTGLVTNKTSNLMGYSEKEPSAYLSTVSGYSFGTTNQ